MVRARLLHCVPSMPVEAGSRKREAANGEGEVASWLQTHWTGSIQEQSPRELSGYCVCVIVSPVNSHIEEV